MTDLHLAHLIGMIIFGVCMGIGIWRIKVEKKYEGYCKDCCNPDHWLPEDREKTHPNNIKMMKDNIELFKKSERF